MLYIVHRTQIYLDETAAGKLDERARARGWTRSALIRDAIDRYLEFDDRAEGELAGRQRSALLGAFGVDPDVGEAVAALRAQDAERAAALVRRRRG